MKNAFLILAVSAGLVLSAAEPPKVLVFSRCEGYRHGAAIEACCAALAEASAAGRYAVDFTNEYAALAIGNLQRYRALVLNNTTALKTKEHPALAPDLAAFVRWGGGLCALHAAADCFFDAPEAAHLVGGLFKGHPWGARGTWAFKVEDRASPLCAAFKDFPDGRFTRSDEIYQHGSPFYDRAKLHVLVSLDMDDPVTAGAQGQIRTDKDNAVSWIRRYGAGRVFYTSFGHDRRAWETADTRAHIFAGLDYTLGLLKADDAPSRVAPPPPAPKTPADAWADVTERPYVGVDGRVREARYEALGAALGRAVEEDRAHEAAPVAAKVFARRELPEMTRACAARVLLADDPAKLGVVLADPSRRVREAAFGPGLRIPAERFAAALPGASPALTRALVARLAQDGAKAQAGAVAACAAGADDETAVAIARALGQLGGVAEVPVVERLRARGGAVAKEAEEALADMDGIGELVFARAAQEKAWLDIAARRAERQFLPSWRAFIAHGDAKVRKAAWKAFGKMIDESTFAEASAWFAAVRPEEAEAAANALWRVVKERDAERNAALLALWRRTTPAGRPAIEELVQRANGMGAFDVWEGVVAAGGPDAPDAKKAYGALAEKVLGGEAVMTAAPKREKWSATASRNPGRAKNAFDGKPETRWDTGWKPKGQWFALDLGETFFVETVTLDVAKSPRDTPKGCDVYVSRNGEDWEGPVATCDEKTEKKSVFAIARRARHLKFVARGEDPRHFWSIHEIDVKAGVDKALLAKVKALAEKYRGEMK